MLGLSDFSDTRTQFFFALWDNNSGIGNVRTSLAPRAITVSSGKRTISGNAINWAAQRGWLLDLPAGEKVSTDPSIAYGVLTFSTNSPSAVSCSSDSALYVADLASGLQLPDNVFPGGQAFYGVQFTPTLTAQVSISRLPPGSIVVTPTRVTTARPVAS